MTLPIVLAIAGSIALLVGLFGGGVKAKEIEVPKISSLSRIFSIVIGVALIGIAAWLTLPSQQPSTTPQPTAGSASESTTSTTISPTSPQPTIVPTHSAAGLDRLLSYPNGMEIGKVI